MSAALPWLGPQAGAEVALWDRLVSVAVIGTDRRLFDGDHVPEPLRHTVAVASASAGFGGVVAAVWAYLQAGRAPREALPEALARATAVPAAADSRALLPGGALRTLAVILADVKLRPVLREWLYLAARGGRRLPPEWVPDLVDALGPVGGPLLRDLETAVGPRLSWLAHHDPPWSALAAYDGGRSPGRELAARLLTVAAAGAAADPDLRRHWASATDEERISAFADVRGADPTVARRLVGLVWPDEPGSTRASIVAHLDVGLSLADEPFLESCLGDRRGDVRREALRLLGTLPGSGFGHRMAGRTLPYVHLRLTPRPVLEISPPAEIDPSAARDGLGSFLGGGSAGHWRGRSVGEVPESQRGPLLVQMIAATPLDEWESYLGRTAEELIDLAIASEADQRLTSTLLIEGWSQAAAAQRNGRWAAALLAVGARPTSALTELVPAEMADRARVAWISARPMAEGLQLLLPPGGPDGPASPPWSPTVSRTVLERLFDLVASGDTSTTSSAAPVREALGSLALVLHPDEAPAVAAVAAALERLADGQRGPRGAAVIFWRRHLSEMVAVIHFRRAMYQEFR